MKPEQFNELWMIRFRKIADGEKEALLFYKGLLQTYDFLLGGTRAQSILNEIKKDEAKHFRIANEMITLLKRKNIRKKRKHK